MREFIIVLLCGGGLALLFYIFGTLTKWAAKKERTAWQDFATANGLTFNGASQDEGPYMDGQYYGQGVFIDTVVHDSGEDRHTCTRFTATLRQPLPFRIFVTGESWGDRVVKLFGGQDIQLGIPDADKVLRIKGDNEAGIRELLTRPAVLKELLRFIKTQRSAALTSADTKCEISGFISDPKQLTAHLDSVAAVAYTIDEARGLARTPTPPAMRG